MTDSSGAKIAISMALLPLIAMSTVLVVLAGGGANATPSSAACGSGGTAQTIGSTDLDAEQMGNAQTVVSVTAVRHLPVLAAVVAVTAAYTESKLRNSTVQTDHDSEGLFQQRVSIYSAAVAADPVRATNAFLDRLVRISGWRTGSVGADAQAVQISEYPGRYQPNAPLAAALVDQFWSAALAAPPLVTGAHPAVCPGGGGAGGSAGPIVGARGNNIAGTTSVPFGFVISGSARARRAVSFALSQLGKPYVFGAAGPDAFDCSGLTEAAWASAGVALPHLASGQTAVGTAESTDLRTAVGGDLVMIPGADGTAQDPGHVGMIAGYVDRADGRHLYLVQAPETGVPVELTEATEWTGQVTDVRHIA